MNNISNEFENKKNQYDSSEKFISSSDQDNLIKDLKDSFMESIYSTDEIFKNSLGEIQNKLSLNLIFEEE